MHIAQDEFTLDPVPCTLNGCDEPARRIVRLRYAVLDSIPLPLLIVGYSCWIRCLAGHEPVTRRFFHPGVMVSVLYKNTGLLLCVLMGLGYGQYAASKHQDTLRYLQGPRVNDFWFVDHRQFDAGVLKGFQYTTYQVIQVNEDSVEVKVGNIYHDKPVSPRQHVQYDQVMQRQFFSGKTRMISRQRLSALAESGGIYAVRRPSNMTIDGWIVLKRSNAYTNPN